MGKYSFYHVTVMQCVLAWELLMFTVYNHRYSES